MYVGYFSALISFELQWQGTLNNWTSKMYARTIFDFLNKTLGSGQFYHGLHFNLVTSTEGHYSQLVLVNTCSKASHFGKNNDIIKFQTCQLFLKSWSKYMGKIIQKLNFKTSNDLSLSFRSAFYRSHWSDINWTYEIWWYKTNQMSHHHINLIYTSRR